MSILSWFGWKIENNVPKRDRCVICVAPHTSNVDLWVGLLAFATLKRGKPNFLMKKEWFRFPLGWFFRLLGGFPVDRSKHTSITDQMAEHIKSADHFVLAVTPEGTRKPNADWKKGFYFIAQKAGVPIQLAYIDYKEKRVGIGLELIPSGDIEADMRKIKDFYKGFTGKHPENFVVE